MSKNNQELLQDLEEKTRACPPPTCDHLAQSCRGLVFGAGNPDAKIVFIGEAPGEQEDKQGIPFVGQSGQELNVLLKDIGMVRDDVYITNIVKFRPPGNRDPKHEEKSAFLPILLQQLDIIKPEVIATLGKHATMSLLPEVNYSKVLGTPQRDAHGRVIVPILHPAYVLYQPQHRHKIEAQFEVLRKLVAGEIGIPALQESLF